MAYNRIGSLTQTVIPTVEPVSVAQVKSNKRIDFTDEDAFIGDLVSQARQMVEAITHRQLVNATWEYRLDCFPEVIYLPRPPLSSVTSVAYVDTSGNSQTLDTSQYVVDSNSQPGRITEAYSATWPSTYYQTDAVTITYVAGYGATAATVPWPLRRAVLLVASHYWEYRDAEVALPEGILETLDPWIEPTYA